MQPLQSSGAGVITTIDHQSTGRVLLSIATDNKLTLLTQQEVTAIDEALQAFTSLEYEYKCNSNVLSTLQKLPAELVEKLIVVIATHEGNALMTYYNKKYNHHVFMMGNTEKGLQVFDSQNPDGTSMQSTLWLDNVYKKQAIEHCLDYPVALKYLPQFRLVNGAIYTEYYDDACAFEMKNPEYAILDNGAMSGLPLWKASYSINLYEITQLFKGVITYGEAISHHQDRASPLKRLKDEHMAYLREVFVNAQSINPQSADFDINQQV